jgi:hypothetical protein
MTLARRKPVPKDAHAPVVGTASDRSIAHGNAGLPGAVCAASVAT